MSIIIKKIEECDKELEKRILREIERKKQEEEMPENGKEQKPAGESFPSCAQRYR
jgi:hypothetical protein